MKEIDNENMTKEDFIQFAKDLANDFSQSNCESENDTLELYLQALVA